MIIDSGQRPREYQSIKVILFSRMVLDDGPAATGKAPTLPRVGRQRGRGGRVPRRGEPSPAWCSGCAPERPSSPWPPLQPPVASKAAPRLGTHCTGTRAHHGLARLASSGASATRISAHCNWRAAPQQSLVSLFISFVDTPKNRRKEKLFSLKFCQTVFCFTLKFYF